MRQSENLNRLYSLRFFQKEDYRNKVWQILCSCYFQKFIPQNSNILDLGAGYGEFINNINAASKYAMDLNPNTENHLSKDIKYIHQDCSERWVIESDFLDIIFTSNFIEHLQDKTSVERTILECYRCLKDGGLFICLCPNIKYIPGAYWDFWDHNVPLTELSISELLNMNDFVIEQCFDRFLPYTMSSPRRRPPPIFLIKLYLRLPILWPFIGKQFLVIARKNASYKGT